MGTHYQGTKAEVRALDAYIKLLRASDSIVGRLGQNLRAEDELTLSQFGVLEALLHLGPMCQRDLGAKILKSSWEPCAASWACERRNRRSRRRRPRILRIQRHPKDSASLRFGVSAYDP